jgi:hypothetical protein
VADPIIFPVPDPDIRNPKDLNSVWFEWKDDKDEGASAAAGHPVFDSVVLAHIMGPGMQKSEATRIVLRKKQDGSMVEDARNLKPQLDAFLKGDPGQLAGTPLTELAILDAGAIATLKAIGVHNVESLAAIAETAAPQLLGFRKYKTAAVALLDQRKGQEPLNKLAAENDALKAQLEALQGNYDDLAARVAELTEKKQRKAA